MKNRSRLAILASALLLGGASVFVVAYAASVPVHPSPAVPAAPAAQQEQTGEHQDANDAADKTENQTGAQAEDAAGNAEKQDPAGAQVGHQDAPGTADQTGDNQD